MRKHPLAIAITVFLAGCTTAVLEQPSPSGEGVIGTFDDGWKPGETLVYRPATTAFPKGHYFRQGKTDTGVAYRYHPDGSGNTKAAAAAADNLTLGWSFGCEKDKITDRTSCSLTSFEAKILISFSKDLTPAYFCIIGHDFPGRRGAVRVDQNAPRNTDTEGCLRAAPILAEMRKGKEITVRYVEWPYDYSRDTTTDLDGFTEALELMKFTRDANHRVTFHQ